MIAAIIIISLAFAWLLKETDLLRVKLESTEYQKAVKAQGKVNHEVNHDTETENRTPYRPSEFVPLDMPEFTGKVNIICERG